MCKKATYGFATLAVALAAGCGSGGLTTTGSRNDLTGPVPGAVNDGPSGDVDTQQSRSSIHANWSGFRDESGIRSYEWAIGSSPGGIEVQGWRDVGPARAAANNELALATETTYFVTVRATDRRGNRGGSARSDGVRVVRDADPPTPGTVNDGSGDDIDSQASATTISANWSGFVDQGSGISHYEWAIGTAPGSDDVQGWVNIGTAESATNGSLALVAQRTYYASVRATDAANNRSEPGVSDGVTVERDTTGPTPGSVRDGAGNDIDIQSSTTTIVANWSGFADPSGIDYYEWAIGTSSGAADVQSWTRLGNVATATNDQLTLADKRTYFVSVRAYDRVGNRSSAATSNGVTVQVVGGSSLSQYGITWTFDKQHQVGQFVNGDHWVIGPVKIISITPRSEPINGHTRHGSMINPRAGDYPQGYDSSIGPVPYSAALNVALNVSPQNPLMVPTHSSLVSTISVDGVNQRPQVKTAAILTVLATAPPTGAFRPPYCGNNKTSVHLESHLQTGGLASLARPAAAPPLAAVERSVERPWIDHQESWSGRHIHPADNMPDYGRDLSSTLGIAALTLHTNYSLAQKRTLLIRFVQIGIDSHGIVLGGGRMVWKPNGGHGSGRKWPILFAGLVLNDTTMRNIGQRKDTQFGEDGQTFYVAETSPGVYNYGYGGYTAADVGLPEWGMRHSTDPSLDSKDLNNPPYRTCCTANAWSGHVLSARIMNAQALWNHPALFDYHDRYMSTISKNIASSYRSWTEFEGDMWDLYRSRY